MQRQKTILLYSLWWIIALGTMVEAAHAAQEGYVSLDLHPLRTGRAEARFASYFKDDRIVFEHDTIHIQDTLFQEAQQALQPDIQEDALGEMAIGAWIEVTNQAFHLGGVRMRVKEIFDAQKTPMDLHTRKKRNTFASGYVSVSPYCMPAPSYFLTYTESCTVTSILGVIGCIHTLLRRAPSHAKHKRKKVTRRPRSRQGAVLRSNA